MHEWMHYRYGVFDEYPVGDDDHFYVKDGNIEATRCSLAVKGKLGRTRANTYTMYHFSGENYNQKTRKTGETACKVNGTTGYERDCRFIPEPGNTSTAAASLMYAQYLDQVRTEHHAIGLMRLKTNLFTF